MSRAKRTFVVDGFEHRGQPLLPKKKFIRRLAAAFALASCLVSLWTLIGICGYHWLAGLGWVDAFLNAAMIVGGMGPVDVLSTSASKLFAGFYAILSGVVFLVVFGLLMAPIFHRFLHRFHLDSARD